MLDYRYETFFTLCQEGSYTLTAEKLFITQPAVSQHIKWLETTYQTKLVTYEHRNISLTNKGQSLFDAIVKLKAQILKIESDLLQPESAPEKLNFAATLSIGDDLLPKILVQLAQARPELQIACSVENTKIILEKLRLGTLDFALVEGNFPKGEFASQPLAAQPFIAVTHIDHPLRSDQTYQLAELLKIPLITREEGSGSRELLEHLLGEQNYSLGDFQHLLEIGNLKTTKALLAENIGLAFLYQGVVQEELRNCQVKEIPIYNMATSHSFYFIYLKDSLFEEDLLAHFELFRSFL